MNVLIIFITIIMFSFSDEFRCLVIAVLRTLFHSANNTIQDKIAPKSYNVKRGILAQDISYWQVLSRKIALSLKQSISVLGCLLAYNISKHIFLSEGPWVFNRQP